MSDHQTSRLQDHKQDLAGKVAIVTGASRGIGYAIALNLARRGAGLLVTPTSASKHIGAPRADTKSPYAQSDSQPPKVAHAIVPLEDFHACTKLPDAVTRELQLQVA